MRKITLKSIRNSSLHQGLICMFIPKLVSGKCNVSTVIQTYHFITGAWEGTPLIWLPNFHKISPSIIISRTSCHVSRKIFFNKEIL